ncbi:MAG TPA: hypothetical protein VK994_07845 [Bacteroidales bacterium]|nr:hypothetical protein [Bacteroidales bacterium]
MTDHNNIPKSHQSEEHKLKMRFGNESPFREPEGYFEALPQTVLNKALGQKKNQVKKSWPVTITFNRILATAAAVILLVGVSITIMLMNRAPAAESAEDYSLMEIYQYNFGNLAELEEAYLMSLAGDKGGENIFALPVDTTGITNEDIINYLLAENHIEYLTINQYQ